MDTTDPTPILIWHPVASPTTLILAAGVLLAFLAIVALTLELQTIRHHLKSIRIHIRESRDWFRRNAADQRAAAYHTLVYKPQLLTRHLDYLERQSAVTVQDVRQAKAEDPEVIDALHSLLTYYDALALAVEHGVLSERVIKAAHHADMLRALRVFRPYIENHRAQSAPDAWSHFEKLVATWQDPNPQSTAKSRKRAA